MLLTVTKAYRNQQGLIEHSVAERGCGGPASFLAAGRLADPVSVPVDRKDQDNAQKHRLEVCVEEIKKGP